MYIKKYDEGKMSFSYNNMYCPECGKVEGERLEESSEY